MERFLNIIKQQAGALDQGASQPRFATVQSVNPATATAKVTLQPEGVLSGWLPILSPWIGAGWGMCCPPSPGDQVLILAQEGDAEHGIIVGRAFSNTQPPLATPVGELWLVSRLPSFSQHPESIGKHGELGEHGSEALDQGRQPRLRHIGDQIVEHAALPEQRVSTSLGGV
jgi:hypothetical protein